MRRPVCAAMGSPADRTRHWGIAISSLAAGLLVRVELGGCVEKAVAEGRGVGLYFCDWGCEGGVMQHNGDMEGW